MSGSEQNGSENPRSPNENIWPNWQRRVDREESLRDECLRKFFDVPTQPQPGFNTGGNTVNNTSGVGVKGVAGIAAVSALGPLALAGMMLWNQAQRPEPVSQEPKTETRTETETIFKESGERLEILQPEVIPPENQ